MSEHIVERITAKEAVELYKFHGKRLDNRERVAELKRIYQQIRDRSDKGWLDIVVGISSEGFDFLEATLLEDGFKVFGMIDPFIRMISWEHVAKDNSKIFKEIDEEFKAAGKWWIGYTGAYCYPCEIFANVPASRSFWECPTCCCINTTHNLTHVDTGRMIGRPLHAKPAYGPTKDEYEAWMKEHKDV